MSRPSRAVGSANIITEPARHDAPELHPVPSFVVATWPVGTFIENIVALPGGDFLLSIENRQQLQRVARDGSKHVFARLPHGPTGIVADRDAFFVLAGEPGRAAGVVFKVFADGAIDEWLTIPESLFLNGFTPYRAGHALAVDSIHGLIIDINLDRPAYTVWLQHELLTKISAEPMLPGVNGIKVNDGAVYVTNTDRALVLRIAMRADGTASEPEIVAQHLRGDDIAFDRGGNLYITTHIHNSLVRLAPDGSRIALAGLAQGMAGCTACTFGVVPGEHEALFVTTTGGLVMPADGVVQEAKLVRVAVGAVGSPIAFSD